MGLVKKYPGLFFGLAITLFFLWIDLSGIKFLDSLELKFYDIMMGFRIEPETDSEILIVDIDNDSIEKLGRWPWPRCLLAECLKKIDDGRPRVIGLNIILSEPDGERVINEFRALEKLYAKTVLTYTGEKGLDFLQTLRKTRAALDNDRQFADALKSSGKVVLPSFFKNSKIKINGSKPSAAMVKQSIQNVNNPDNLQCSMADEIVLPIPAFLKASKGTGHINLAYDIDGTARRERLLYEYRGLYIPSYTLRLTAEYLNIPVRKIHADIGSAIYLGSFEIPVTLNSELLISFKGGRGSFKTYSFFDVINDKIPLSIFKNKIVLISPSAAGIINPLSTPTETYMPLGEFTANTIWAMLNKKFIQQLEWGLYLKLCITIFLGLIITFVWPSMKALTSGITFIFFLAILVGAAVYFFVFKDMWLQMTYPFLQLIAGYIGVVSIQSFVAETGREKFEGESAETNRQLGISFQSQGMLDMAFDKLRRVPVDDQMKDILYNLALDYERKRQYNKAASVYEYIEKYDEKFKDVAEKKKKLLLASETMMFGDNYLGGGSGDGTIMPENFDTRPTLGRYEIIKKLGKGAMGIVYLGKDPRINRTTAIKTFKFSEEYEPEKVERLKEKFFREAESAGALSHPNIVTIYDAGDEHDLAYIAMEFLEGNDLGEYTKKGNLLPMRKVIDYGADIAEALDYAHEQGVIHRDIKPANIMLLKNYVIKITDFGIARITGSSQTQTGIVKGTPYYMAPEQIAGKKVDGRADIFSLGTMLFQLLTGQVPFKGENPAELMHKIMNMPHPNPKKINPDIVTPLVSILNKAMEKDREKRYQKAGHMAYHLKKLGKSLDNAMARRIGSKKTTQN